MLWHDPACPCDPASWCDPACGCDPAVGATQPVEVARGFEASCKAEARRAPTSEGFKQPARVESMRVNSFMAGKGHAG
eukprot:358707-Chlamydomonas_euryale.AAC.7